MSRQHDVVDRRGKFWMRKISKGSIYLIYGMNTSLAYSTNVLDSPTSRKCTAAAPSMNLNSVGGVVVTVKLVLLFDSRQPTRSDLDCLSSPAVDNDGGYFKLSCLKNSSKFPILD